MFESWWKQQVSSGQKFLEEEAKRTEPIKIDKTITFNMLLPDNPEIILGKDITPNDVATLLVRTIINLDATQYIEKLTSLGFADVAYRLGKLTQEKTSAAFDILLAHENSIKETNSKNDDSPIVSPMEPLNQQWNTQP